MPKKKAKKAVRKPRKAPRKVASGRKTPKQRKPRIDPRLRGLTIKKLEILAAVPIMPCSVLGRDWQGNRFAHTRAEEVYKVYREECTKRGLTIRRTKSLTTDCEISQKDSEDRFYMVSGVRFEGEWEIKDRSTGQCETFGGSGDGLNDVWSAISAQTIAKKQALLDYFETAWPQPTDHLRVIQESLAAVPDKEKVEAYKQILGAEAWSIMTATGAVKRMADYYSGDKKCQKQSKTKSK